MYLQTVSKQTHRRTAPATGVQTPDIWEFSVSPLGLCTFSIRKRDEVFHQNLQITAFLILVLNSNLMQHARRAKISRCVFIYVQIFTNIYFFLSLCSRTALLEQEAIGLIKWEHKCLLSGAFFFKASYLWLIMCPTHHNNYPFRGVSISEYLLQCSRN